MLDLEANPIIPVIVLDDPEDAEPLAESLLEGGLGIIEVTFRTEAAAESIDRIARRFPEMAVGAGTVVTPAQAKRAHPYKKEEKHGFISSQREGMDIFAKIDRKAPLIVAEAVWQYSHHLLHGLISHEGPILTVANWSGTWPGLVGMLNLNGSLTKAGVPYSTLWSEDFVTDKKFQENLATWMKTGSVNHPTSHVRKFSPKGLSDQLKKTAVSIASDLDRNKSIMGVFDEFCMGMYNATIPDELMFPTGVFKERLSQSALVAEMKRVTNKEAEEVFAFIEKRGFNFHFGKKHKTDLTRGQVLDQCRMYIAACRIGDTFGCEALGIQYQQGLKDLCPASDLVEGMLNSTDRPPVTNDDGKVIREGQPYPHFNEVDECCGLDAILANRVHKALRQPVETTLHDLRWGDWDQSGTTDEYVWVFLISGSAPVEHHVGGWKGSHGYRQPAMYFPNGGSALHGIAKPGEIVWSRIFIEDGKLRMDLGRAKAISLPAAPPCPFYISDAPSLPERHVRRTPRIGVDYAESVWAEKPYRFVKY